MSQHVKPIESGPGWRLVKSEIKDQTVLPIIFDFPIPPGYDEVTLLITAYAPIATDSSYELFQNPGKPGIQGLNPEGFATGDVLAAATTAQVLTTVRVATDVLRVRIDPDEAGDTQQYQVNALITKRTPDR